MKVRWRLLKEYPLWDAFALDVLEDIPRVPKSRLKEHIRRKAKLYLIAYFLSRGFGKEVIRKVLFGRFGLKVFERDFKLVSSSLPSGVKVKKNGVALSEVLGDFCPPGLERAKIRKEIAEVLKRRLERKLKRKRPLKILDGIAMKVFAVEYERRKRYGKNMDLKKVARTVQLIMAKLGKEFRFESVYREVSGRLRKKFQRNLSKALSSRKPFLPS